MVEFEEKSNRKEVMEVDTCDNGSEVRKRVPGVTKWKNRWQARVQHPKLKFDIYMGVYDSHEKAVLVVEKAKAEFQEMLKGDSSTNEKTCRDDFEGRRLPPGIRRSGYKRWSTRIYHPGLKRNISLGSYKSLVDASIALDNKRDEFLKVYGCRLNFHDGGKSNDNLLQGPNLELTDDLEERARVSKLRVKVKRDCKLDDEVVEEPNREVAVTRFEIGEKLTSHLKVPRGVRKLKSGKWCVETLVLDSDNLNNNSIRDKSNIGVSLAAVPDKPERMFVQGLPTSIFEPEISERSKRSMISEGNEQKSGCVSEFDEAMNLGIINEYGQLVGEYSKLDEEMEFSLPGDDVADTGWF